jgi:hypothetical protein
VHERIAEYVLADALDDQPLGFRRSRQPSGLDLEPPEGRVGQADGKLVDAIKRGMELRQRRGI